ncbi:glycosyltransferase domain-containing protein [Pseudomonas sp. NFACC02]|uniref:TIGR00180 family glycosyltransferase n=1 Tax=Pseudomonas sp. NFACC02 TaxID=1566250 RepID=UPI0008B72307|nr:TIGR00180 family glycosyltransferase [Pseudomonas sp. NFACC02]SEQ36966.1 glycosyltransferase domain-containing protein [Pseudomonas sp. NFACC02]
MSLDEQLTLVVLTHNRPAFLRRTLQFYSTLPARVLVLDSSPESAGAIAELFPQVDYRHLPQFSYSGLQEKVAYGVGQVTTPFMTFVPDDDFLLHDALVQSVDFLAAHPDYGLCHGYCLMYLAYGNKVEYFRRDKKVCEDYASEDAAERVLSYLGQYIPPFYAVTRTELLLRWYAALPKGTGFELQEFGHAYFLLSCAKARILPIPYVVREVNYLRSEHQTDILAKLCDPDPRSEAERQQFVSFLGALDTGLNDKALQERTQVALASISALKTCLQEARSLTLTSIIFSRWNDVFAPVDREFGPRQFVEMPFYNQAFFDVLSDVEFLIHAMPAGKLQMEQLEGVWTQQELLLRTHENDTSETIANRLWEAMTLNIFNPHIVEPLLELMAEQDDQEEVEQLSRWLERLKSVQREDHRVRFNDMPSGRVLQWLDARKPGAEDVQAITTRIAELGGCPQFGILLLDLEDDMSKLQLTLDSLVEGHCKNFKVVVFTTGEPPAATTVQNTLHFVKVSKNNWVEKVNQTARQSSCDWLMLAEVGDEFTPGGLLRAALELQAAPECRAVFADEIQRLPGGALTHVMRPGFNLDLLQSHPSLMSRHWLMRRDVLLEAGGYSADFEQAPEFELLLRVIEKGGLAWLAHLDEPLLICDALPTDENPHQRLALTRHLNQRGYKAQVSAAADGAWRIDYRHSQRPLVSILLRSEDNLEDLQRCLSSILLRTRYSNYEVLIADNHSESPELVDWLARQEKARVSVMRMPRRLSHAALANAARQKAKGEYLVLLSAQAEVVSPNWIDSLLNHALRPEIGVVGAKLLDRSDRVSQAGLILGMNGGVGSAFIGEAKDAQGYMQRLVLDQNYGAVSDACLMVRAEVFDAAGGLDEETFAEAFSDVDLCLKLAQAGYMTVWTPQVHVVHPGTLPQAPEALAALQHKWADAFAHDLAYNKNLALTGKGFTLGESSGSTWAQLLA